MLRSFAVLSLIALGLTIGGLGGGTRAEAQAASWVSLTCPSTGSKNVQTSCRVDITNGSSTISYVDMAATLTGGKFVAGAAGQGACLYTSQSATCDLLSLAPGASTNVVLKLVPDPAVDLSIDVVFTDPASGQTIHERKTAHIDLTAPSPSPSPTLSATSTPSQTTTASATATPTQTATPPPTRTSSVPPTSVPSPTAVATAPSPSVPKPPATGGGVSQVAPDFAIAVYGTAAALLMFAAIVLGAVSRRRGS